MKSAASARCVPAAPGHPVAVVQTWQRLDAFPWSVLVLASFMQQRAKVLVYYRDEERLHV